MPILNVNPANELSGVYKDSAGGRESERSGWGTSRELDDEVGAPEAIIVRGHRRLPAMGMGNRGDDREAEATAVL